MKNKEPEGELRFIEFALVDKDSKQLKFLGYMACTTDEPLSRTVQHLQKLACRWDGDVPQTVKQLHRALDRKYTNCVWAARVTKKIFE